MVGAGSDFRWDCTAKGQPKPVITWKKDGEELGSGFSQHIRILANNSLMIRGARPGDEGQYQCHASNGFGAHVVQAKLVVRGEKNACHFGGKIGWNGKFQRKRFQED